MRNSLSTDVDVRREFLAGTRPRYKKCSRWGFNPGPLLVLLLMYYALPVVCTSRYILLAKRSILTFMMMSRLAQYWLMDISSWVLDQRMSIIGKIEIWLWWNRRGKHLMTWLNTKNRRGMPLDISMNRRTNHTSQALSMVSHASHGCIGKECSDFGFGIWLSTHIPYPDLQWLLLLQLDIF